MRCCGHLLSDQFITCYLLLFSIAVLSVHPSLFFILFYIQYFLLFAIAVLSVHPSFFFILFEIQYFLLFVHFIRVKSSISNFLCRRLISNFQLFMQEINLQSVAKNDLLRTLSSEDPIRKIVSSFAIFSHLNQPVDASSDSSSLSSSSTSTANNTSWVRFFVEEQENYFVCLLLVDPLHKHHRDHTNKISKSGGISNVARHFRGICHKEHHEVEKMLFSNRFTRSSLALHHQRSMRIS